jgi:hypothetical protein
MTKRLRIPTDQEIQTILKWGSIRVLIALPQAALFTLKQTARLILHCTSTFDNLYQTAIVNPFDSLIWNDLPSRIIEAEVLPNQIIGKPELFDWSMFKKEPDNFPHIRIIAKTGMGKTTLAEWLLHMLGGEQFVITPKSKPTDWGGYQVFGKRFDYQECADKLESIRQQMCYRFDDLDQGKDFGFINFVCDEWRLIVDNKPEVKDIMREIVTLARDAKIRMIAIAQGEQVKTWGLEGESDLEECFTTIRLGQFAIDHAKKLKLSQSVFDWIQQQKRPCMIDNQPGEIPDLSHFKNSFNVPATQLQTSLNPIPNLEAKNYSELLQNLASGSQTQNQDELLWTAIDAVLLSDPSRSADWLCKKIIMPRCNCGRPKAEQILQELREKFNKNYS